MDSTTTASSVNIPSVLLAAILSFFAIRYFFFSPTSTTAASRGLSGPTVPADRVEQVATMFPQLSRRDIEWDLLRNGGSIQATSERVLRAGRLPAPPPNFRPSTPAPGVGSPTTSSTGSSTTASSPAAQKQAHQDLIQRYNLSSRISSSSGAAGGEDVAVKGRQAWSASKGDREALLKKRREDMVLAARRKMEQTETGNGKGKERAL